MGHPPPPVLACTNVICGCKVRVWWRGRVRARGVWVGGRGRVGVQRGGGQRGLACDADGAGALRCDAAAAQRTQRQQPPPPLQHTQTHTHTHACAYSACQTHSHLHTHTRAHTAHVTHSHKHTHALTYTRSTSGRSSRSTLMFMKWRFMMAACVCWVSRGRVSAACVCVCAFACVCGTAAGAAVQ
jgi:hypothetical protein